MKNLTRYAYVHDEQDGVCFCRIVESDSGEWVRFSDVMEALTTAPNSQSDAIRPCTNQVCRNHCHSPDYRYHCKVLACAEQCRYYRA